MGDHIRSKRFDVGLTQRTLARQLGVREETIHLWETGRSKPLSRHHASIVRFLGYDPEPDVTSPGERLRACRRRSGLTQAELAERLGVDEGTIVDLEAGRRRPARKVAAAIEAVLANDGLGDGSPIQGND